MKKATYIAIVLQIIILLIGLFGAAFYERDITIKERRIKAEKADYLEDIDTIELSNQLNKLATDLDLFVYIMKTTDNYIFDENEFKDFQMYSDFIIYGDEVYNKANDVEYKVYNAGMMIGVINYHMDDINTFIYSLGKNRKYYEFLWKDIYIDISDVNKAIEKYNKSTDSKISKIGDMKVVDRKSIKAGKENWKLIEDAVYPQGDLK